MMAVPGYRFGPVSQSQPAPEGHLGQNAHENGNMAIYNAIMRAEVKLQDLSRSRYHHGLYSEVYYESFAVRFQSPTNSA